MRSWQGADLKAGNQAIWQSGVFRGTRVRSVRQGEGGSRGSWQLAAGSSIGQLVKWSIGGNGFASWPGPRGTENWRGL